VPVLLLACVAISIAACGPTNQTSGLSDAPAPTAEGPAKLVCSYSSTVQTQRPGDIEELHLTINSAKNDAGRYPIELTAKRGGAAVDFPAASIKAIDADGTLSPTSANMKLRDAAQTEVASLTWTGTKPASPADAPATGKATLSVVALERDYELSCNYELPKPPVPDCVQTAQKILILDFKSGWWAGDGGRFFQTILEGLTLECDSKVSIEYHHILGGGGFPGGPSGIPGGPGGIPGGPGGIPGGPGGIPGGPGGIPGGPGGIPGGPGGIPGGPGGIPGGPGGIPDGLASIDQGGVLNLMMTFPDFNGREDMMPADFATGFRETDWTKYSQIWVLSGSHADPADIKVGHPFFTEILERIGMSGASMLIGAGYGSITHANSVSTKLGIGSRFATDNPEGRILAPMNTTIVTSLKLGAELTTHPVLTSGVAEIGDKVNVAGEEASSDYIMSLKGFMSVAKCGGKDCIAVNNAETKKVMLEAGLQRYYSITNNQSPETLKFLRNAIQHLAK
jgi:hypothetical protein